MWPRVDMADVWPHNSVIAATNRKHKMNLSATFSNGRTVGDWLISWSINGNAVIYRWVGRRQEFYCDAAGSRYTLRGERAEKVCEALNKIEDCGHA